MFLAGTRPTGLRVLFQSFTSSPVSNFISTNYTIKPIASGAPCWPQLLSLSLVRNSRNQSPWSNISQHHLVSGWQKETNTHQAERGSVLEQPVSPPPPGGDPSRVPCRKFRAPWAQATKWRLRQTAFLGSHGTKIICSFSSSEQQYRGSEGSCLETTIPFGKPFAGA